MNRRLSQTVLFRLFLLLSLADLGLTIWLLFFHGSVAYESNPVARWWFDSFGFLGLILFKAVTVSLVVAIALWVGRQRHNLGRGILLAGCCAAVVTVGYSAFLSGRVVSWAWQVNGIASERQQLGDEITALEEYRRLVHKLCDDLDHDRITLRQAVDQLVVTEHGRNEKWLRGLRLRYNTDSARVCLAQNLLERYFRDSSRRIDPATRQRLYSQLVQDFMVEPHIRLTEPTAMLG